MMVRRTLAPVALCLLLASVSLPRASGANPSETAPFPDGARALFAGHSFFVPVAKQFDQIARQSGFDRHRCRFVFSGGRSGSPGVLWRNRDRRAEITDHLTTGDIELFGLTVYSPTDSSAADYRRWFDLALEHNPDTQFYLGHPHPMRGASTPAAEYARRAERLGAEFFKTVQQLRAEYPDNPIHFINYGVAAAACRTRFDAGELPGVPSLLPDIRRGIGRQRALFTDDKPGHAGAVLRTISALSWLELLYGAEMASLTLPREASNVTGIVNEVVGFNQPYQAAMPALVP